MQALIQATCWAMAPREMLVTLLRKNTRGASVHAVIRLHFGDLDSLMNRAAAADLAGAVLIRGTASKNRQQIQDEIDKLKTQLNVYGGATGTGASIQTTRENLPAALRLAGEILKEATLPESEFEQVLRKAMVCLSAASVSRHSSSGSSAMVSLSLRR